MHLPEVPSGHCIMRAELAQKPPQHKTRAKPPSTKWKLSTWLQCVSLTALFSSLQSSSFQPQKKNGATPHILHPEWSESFKRIPLPHNGRFWRGVGVRVGGWVVFEEEQHRHIPEEESCAKPHLTRYFSRDHIHLSPIFPLCGSIDKDTNFLDIWAVISQRLAVPYLCALRGPDSCAQCDLLEVIFRTSVRWQLKNEHLKILFRHSTWLTSQ